MFSMDYNMQSMIYTNMASCIFAYFNWYFQFFFWLPGFISEHQHIIIVLPNSLTIPHSKMILLHLSPP